MANQITIDIGAAANDGTGDPLRTAFNYVNLNFANVWATGLPNSNVQFNNNRVLTVNTNANLILAPNGTGIVQSNVSIVPNTDRVHNLGSAGKKWDSIYANYLNITDLDINADLYVGGNLTVEGDTIQIGNIVTDTKTIQLANTAANTTAANGSGITVGANDNIATFVYNSSFNSWVTNLAVTYSNGQPVGGQPGGANNQVQFNANGVFAGNVNFTFDNATGVLQTAGNVLSHANLEHNLGAPTRVWNYIWANTIFPSQVLATGTIATSGSISATTGISTTGDITANNAVVGNITTSDNLYANVGTFYGDQYGDGAMYVGDPVGTVLGTDVVIQATANAGGYTQINFQNINAGPGASSDFVLTADNGNDVTHYMNMGLTSSGWDGSETNVLSGLTPNNGYLYVQDGNLTIGARLSNTSYAWNFDTAGNISLPTNGSIIVDGGDGSIGPVSDDLVISWDNEEIRIVSVSGSIEMQPNNAFRVQTNYDGGSDTYLSRWEFNQNEIVNITNDFGVVSESGNLNLQSGRDTLSSGNVNVIAINNGVAVNTWTFGVDGNLYLPSEGNIVGTTPNNAGRIQWLGNSSGDGFGYTTLGLIPDDTLVGNDQYLIIDPTAPGHIHIRAGGTQDNSGADLFLGGENSYFKVASGANAEVQVTSNSYTWVFNTDGNLQVPGNINGDNNAPLVLDGASAGLGYISLPHSTFGAEQIAIVNKFSLGNGIRLETNGGNLFFDNNADLSVTGNITGNTAGFAIGYRDIPQVIFSANTTATLADAGKHYYSTESTDYILTIDNNSNVAWPVGTAITVVNRGTGNITIAEGTGVDLYLAGNSTAGNRTISTYGMASLLNVAANVWMINGTGVA